MELKEWSALMSLQLDNKTILITGACGKLGKASTRMFLERGASITATDRIDIAEHPFMQELLEQYGDGRLLLVQADVTEEHQVSDLLEKVRSHFGRLDGSFHNAYAQKSRAVIDYTLEEWEQVVRGTLTSTFLVCKYALKLMMDSGGGAVLNVSSALAHTPNIHNSAYGAAKAGIQQLTRVIAKEHAAHHIRANCIVPGDFKENLDSLSAKFRESMKMNTLIGRSGKPDEIAEFAAFLLSDAASYITGSLHTIDGGYRL